MNVMANKLRWNKKGSIGNVKSTYECYCIFRNKDCKLGEIRVFKKGEYILPEGMFPRNKKSMPQKTKSLLAAKNKVQKWLDEFIKSQM